MKVVFQEAKLSAKAFKERMSLIAHELQEKSDYISELELTLSIYQKGHCTTLHILISIIVYFYVNIKMVNFILT